MPLVSNYFRINKSQAQLDFVDVDTEKDLQLFIDPYVFSKSSDAWSVICHEAIVSFFQSVIDAVRRGDDATGRALLNNLGEPNETCLGLSTGTPAGRGIGRLQADELYDRLKRSRAARTGLLSELSDCELFIVGIGSDKVSDITTNILRRNLIEYTQTQCDLHGIPLVGEVASGMLWDGAEHRWTNQYVSLPVINGQKLILVPKSSVRWKLAFSHQDYYNKFVLEFLQAENLKQYTALVETLKNGTRRVTKKSLKEIHPLAKDFLAEFTERNPRVLETYKKLLSVSNGLGNSEIDDQFNESAFAQSLMEELPNINPGNASANQFHSFMVGVIEFIFYPDLIYPVKEDEINEGRKRIDISYTNNASSGFFFRRHIEARCNAVKVMVECKNYQKEMANPELYQGS
jgi:hypothetical protein